MGTLLFREPSEFKRGSEEVQSASFPEIVKRHRGRKLLRKSAPPVHRYQSGVNF
jgi:hypothetical protein